MRLPLPFLLYVTALCLFGWAGWTVCDSLDLWKPGTMDAATKKGVEDAGKLIARGKGQSRVIADWNYAADQWWPQLKDVNLIGKLPERKPTPEEVARSIKDAEPVIDQTPLEDIFELVSLVYDGKEAGRGANSHVIIRYKVEAAVEPPEWWIRENTPATSNPGSAGGPRDRTLNAAPATARTKRSSSSGRGNRNNRGNRNQSAPPSQPTVMPTSITGREILQKIWVDDGGNVRRLASLWGKYGHIRLVRVAASATSAFFVRELPVKDGEPAPELKEEELLKTTADIPQDVLLALRRLQGREGSSQERPSTSKPKANSWREVENTTRFGNQFHIGRKDEKKFRDTDDFFNNVYVDTYVSKTSSLRGLSVRNIQSEVATAYGVQTGDVLLEVNSRKVSSKAQAVNMVKKNYQSGVRTFSTKWLSNGQVVERVYQAPDK